MLIKNAILFLIETDASETVATSETILAELTLAAVGAVLAVVRHIAVGAVDAFRAPFAPHAERESAAADALARVASVVHVFRVENAEAVVAILGAHRFGELAVLGTKVNNVVSRLAQKKPLKFADEVHRMTFGKGGWMLRRACSLRVLLSKDIEHF